ncbi:MAG: BON domain-containing protein [Gammaproteobacteria bacterium]|nr:BON domain-containing protein [Gammaproteobacteria bacterium]
MLSLYLGACAAAAVGTVVVASVDIARDRRTVGTYVDDNAVEIKIRRELKRDSQISDGAHISVTSMNGIVLLTGEVTQPEEARRAVAIARGYTEARQVINQLGVAEPSSFGSRTRDLVDHHQGQDRAAALAGRRSRAREGGHRARHRVHARHGDPPGGGRRGGGGAAAARGRAHRQGVRVPLIQLTAARAARPC